MTTVYSENVEGAWRRGRTRDVPARVGLRLLVEGVYLGGSGHVVRHEDGFTRRLEAVELFHGPSDLFGGLSAVAVVEEVFLADAAHGLHVVGVSGEILGVLDEDLEVGVALLDAGVARDALDEVNRLVFDGTPGTLGSQYS